MAMHTYKPKSEPNFNPRPINSNFTKLTALVYIAFSFFLIIKLILFGKYFGQKFGASKVFYPCVKLCAWAFEIFFIWKLTLRVTILPKSYIKPLKFLIF